MKDETDSKIHSVIAEMLEARKRYPDTYTDDRIIVMAIGMAAVTQPDAPVCAVYQAARTELVSCLAAEVSENA